LDKEFEYIFENHLIPFFSPINKPDRSTNSSGPMRGGGFRDSMYSRREPYPYPPPPPPYMRERMMSRMGVSQTASFENFVSDEIKF
jgi:hypothetical protein